MISLREMDEESTSSEVLFRPSKRRKFIRKPAHTDIEGVAPPAAEEVITEPPSPEAVDAAVILARRRGGAGKRGINFSTNARRTADAEHNEEQSLMVVGDGDTLQIPANDRFVRPTGRIGPTEDRHMMAYVDSKLAEPRPSGYAAVASSSVEPQTDIQRTSGNGIESTSNTTVTANISSNRPPQERSIAHAQERSRSTYQRPTRRKGPPVRREEDVARDSMIEQIMGENQIPHYEHAAAAADEMVAEDAEDADAAAEDAFKARLLADMEQSNRRRRPAGKPNAIAQTGPKLGGSRAQRERMKAMEEAKGSGVKK